MKPHQHFLNRLPLEVLLYILKHFLDLPDLWTLSQVSHSLKLHSLDTIKKQWKMEMNASNTTTSSLVEVQAHVAIITLHSVARQLIQRIKIYDPYAFPPTLPPLQQILEFNSNGSHSNSNFNEELVDQQQQQQHIISDLNIQQYRGGGGLLAGGLLTLEEDRFEDNATFPPTIEPGLDDIGNENIFLLERLKYHSKRLHSILQLEQTLHLNIIRHALPPLLYETHYIEKRFKTIIDVLFQHVVIVGAIANQRGSWQKLLACSKNAASNQITHAFAAVSSRLLCKLVLTFPDYDDAISTSLFENMTTYLAYIEYRLLAASSNSTTTVDANYHYSNSSNNSNKQQETDITTIGMACCVDLLGATYCSNVLKQDHALFIIRRLCQVLHHDPVRKKVLLFDLMDIWLNINHRGNDEMGRFIQLEITKSQ